MTNAPCADAAFTAPSEANGAAGSAVVVGGLSAEGSTGLGWKGQLLWGLVALALWFFSRQYHGVLGDSRIYLGRALADLSPATAGQDLMFLHDGQSSFSLFPLLTRVLVQHFGAPLAGASIAWVGICLWAAAFMALAFKIAPSPAAWAMLMLVAVLPATYGGLSIIPFGQAAVIPRPFAEAAVMAALWATMDRRRWLAVGLLIAAGLFHPIMAVCGVVVVFLMMGMDDARWLIAGGALSAFVMVAALSGLPLADRLFRPVDSVWLDLLHRRNPYLFTTLWPAETWGRTAVQLATTVLSAMLLRGRARALFACAAVVGAGGVALTFLAGDLYPSLLVLQAQPWRALWLVGVLASGGVAICATTLWRQGPLGQVNLALLGLSWLLVDRPIAMLLAALAVAVQAASQRNSGISVSSRVGKVALGLLAAFVLLHTLGDLQIFPALLRASPPTASIFDTVMLAFDLNTVVLAPLIVVMLLGSRGVRSAVMMNGALVLAVIGVSLSLLRWNAALPTAAFIGPDARLVEMIKTQPGEVQWLNGDTQTWTLADRPAWATELQGASIVFARDAALAWQTRIHRLLSLHLVSAHTLTPWATVDAAVLQPSAAALMALCATPGGPAWIVSPIMRGAAVPAVPGVRLWTAPYLSYLRATATATATATSVTYATISTYAVIPCGKGASKLAMADVHPRSQ
ncbi:MAG: hypothetical protein ACYDD1_09660 [Caulobacteraceae bacterium]